VDLHEARVGLTVTQALLRGAGVDVNLASLRQARLDTVASQYELRGYAEALVANVENMYWDYVLARRQIEIFTDSLALAQRQLEETRQRIEIGKLAKTRNGLLPVLDVFITLGRSGYADSFGDAVGDLDGGGYDVLAGVRMAYPLLNRDARSRHRRARLSRQQAIEAVENLAQLIQVDVRSACIEV